eukprot:3577298-Pyramimonas_sp.AAC.1
MASSWLPRATACHGSTVHSTTGVDWPRPSKLSQWAEQHVQRVVSDITVPTGEGVFRVKQWALGCLA